MTIAKTIALVGVGRWGKNLARNFHSLGVLHTLCDANETLLGPLKAQYLDVEVTADFNSVLVHPDIQAVAIASPAAHHYSLAKQALLAGKDVFVEKPLCLNESEGKELIELAAAQKRILMVGHLLQYHPYIQKLAEIVKEGVLGKLHYIISNRMNLGAFRTEENALWSFAPHDISVILSLCGGLLPQEVRCTGGAYLSPPIVDETLTVLKFPNEVRAHVFVNWLNPFKEQKLTVIGSHAMAVFDDTLPWEQKLQLFRNPVKWMDGRIPKENKSVGEAIVLPLEEPLHNECTHFIHCCQDRKTPRTDGKEGLRVLAVLQAAQRSLEQNGALVVPLEDKQQLPYFAHPSACISPKSTIGSHVKIWHFSHIMDNAQIGDNCNIGQNVVISPGVVLGKNVKVQNNVSVYTGVICEDDVFLGPSAVFTNVINPRSAVNRRDSYLTTYVRQGASIGANATIICGNEIGSHSFIGAGAVVTKPVKPFALVVGNPAKQIGWMSRQGIRLELPLEAPVGKALTARCPESGEEYCLMGSSLQAIVQEGFTRQRVVC